MRVFVPAVVLAMLAALAGCGSSDKAQPKASTTPPSATAIAPATLPGTSVGPAALKGLGCARQADGTWTVSGTVRNTSKASATLEVQAFVSADLSAVAHVQNLGDVAPGATVPFDIAGVPGSGDTPTCRARVVKL